MLKKHAANWAIPTDHFLPNGRPPRARRPLEELLVEKSPVRGTKLKERLYAAGLMERACALCHQGELWNGNRMALILDHINGVNDDNRLENLRVVCANCNATLETHCGRNTRVVRDPRDCARCGESFEPRSATQRYCSRHCGNRHATRSGGRTKTERPPLDELLAGATTVGYESLGRRYGVSGTTIRNWVRFTMSSRLRAEAGTGSLLHSRRPSSAMSRRDGRS
ncbi:MAG: hypothetical protein ABIO51_02340, partial [Solirubrobacteraceae bacterium]